MAIDMTSGWVRSATWLGLGALALYTSVMGMLAVWAARDLEFGQVPLAFAPGQAQYLQRLNQTELLLQSLPADDRFLFTFGVFFVVLGAAQALRYNFWGVLVALFGFGATLLDYQENRQLARLELADFALLQALSVSKYLCASVAVAACAAFFRGGAAPKLRVLAQVGAGLGAAGCLCLLAGYNSLALGLVNFAFLLWCIMLVAFACWTAWKATQP